MLTKKKFFHSVVWGKKKLSAPVISVVAECMLLFSLQIFSLLSNVSIILATGKKIVKINK